MPNRTHRYAAIIAIASLLPLTMSATDAQAKSSHSRSRHAAIAGAASSALVTGTLSSGAAMLNGSGGYYYPPPYPSGRGVLGDNTAGWGNVGAF
jgi:hypothetical protein